MTIRGEYAIGTGVILLGLTLMGFFYWKSGAIDDTRDHQRYVESIRHLQASDAILDQHLLRLRNDSRTSVDRLNIELASMHRLGAILERPPVYISPTGKEVLASILDDYNEVMDRKELLVERFKAENANLKTSIVYYPIISQELIDSLNNAENGEILALQIQKLLRDVLLFNLNTNSALETTIKNTIDRLEVASENYVATLEDTQWDLRPDFEDLSTQGYTILRVKPGVDSLIDELMAMPVALELENLAEEYHLWYSFALERAMFYRFCLYFVAILMVVLLAWLIIRNLDQRIKRATNAIEEQRDQLVVQLAEREAMSDVALAVSSEPDLDTVLNMILEKSGEVVNSEAGSLLLFDGSDELYYRSVRGPVADSLLNTRVKLGEGLIGCVAKFGKTEIVTDPYNDPRFNKKTDTETGFVTRSLLTTPLIAKDKNIGVMQWLNHKNNDSFSDHDAALAELFSAQAAVAIENSRLYEDINSYANDLKESLDNERRLTIEKEKMGAFVSKQVVDEISRSREQKLALGGKIVRATIMFTDIVGFTKISERLEPEQVVEFLNSYMTLLSDIAEDEGGIIDKYIGDSIMAVFLDDAEQAMAAVQAAQRMQKAVADHSESWGKISSELSGVQTRIGINTGRVISGNVGSERRMDYTVMGDNVNVASRIEGACSPGGILISLSTYEDVRVRVKATEMKPITVKNREQQIQTYAV